MPDRPHFADAEGTQTHITSLLVHVLPERAASVKRSLDGFAGVDVHSGGRNEKLIVVAETANLHQVTEMIDRIRDLGGVMDAVPVYHQIEDNETLDLPVDVRSERADDGQFKEPRT